MNDGSTRTFPSNPASCTTCSFSGPSFQTITVDPCVAELKGFRAIAPTADRLKSNALSIESLYYYLEKPSNPICSFNYSKSTNYSSASASSFSNVVTAKKLISLVLKIAIPLFVIPCVLFLLCVYLKKNKIWCWKPKREHDKTHHQSNLK